MRSFSKLAIAAAFGIGLAVGGGTANAQMPKRGGILHFVVGSTIPSFDGHRETTFGMIHPIRPFYSLLIRVNPQDPSNPSDFVCDLCKGKVPEATDNGTTYTFHLRHGVTFHDGTPFTAKDIVATYNLIIFPPKGVPSARQAFFRMVKSVSAPDDYTVVFKLKYPSAAFIPAVATPFNFVYSKKDIDEHGPNWFMQHVNGTGAFKFKAYQPGAYVEGVKWDHYYHMGADGKPLPYLDGYKSIIAPKMAVRVDAIRSGRADIEFRGFPPKARDDLVHALGNKITVQTSDWNCVLLATPNHKRKPYDDPRVRRALTLAIDRWGGSQYLRKIAIVRTVGGVVYPDSKLAATKAELEKLAGYGPDLKKNREEARRLLKEAGHPHLKMNFSNRGVDQPYKIVGTWLLGQWRKIGVDAKQRVQPSGPFYATLRKKHDFDVSIDFNCQSVVNPVADISKFLGSAGNNYGQYSDQKLEDIYSKIERETDFHKLRGLIRQFETRALSTEAHEMVTLWWFRINPYRSYVKGWKDSPSHYLNQHLDDVWLDK